MSVWVLSQALSAEEEGAITLRTHLHLPYEGLPDVSRVDSPAAAKQLLRALHPSDPPESIARRFDTFWALHSAIHPEDIIAVPLPHSQRIAIAQVSGRYEYQVGAGGTDIHLIPVTWPCAPVAARVLRKFPELLATKGMREVTDRDARIALHGTLPLKHNRFHKWRWLLALFMGMGLVRFVLSLLEQQ